MDKKVIGIAAAGVVAVGCVAGSIYQLVHATSAKNEPASSVASSMPESESESTANSIIEEDPAEFKLMDFGDTDTMVGRADYFNLGWITENQNEFRESLNLQKVNTEYGPMKTGTGHQIYKSANEDEEEDARYIISGYSVVKLWEGQVQDTTYLREENTGVRIYVQPNKSAEAAFLDDWDSGSRILSGKTLGEKGDIIVDGRLIHAQYTEIDGEIYFNLGNVASQIDTAFLYSEEDGRLMIYPNEFCCVTIPTTAANRELKEYYHIVDDHFSFSSWAGEGSFTFEAPVLEYDTLQISARDASRMFGWRMYTNGTVLSIVSDPLNVSNETVVYANGSMGIETIAELVDGVWMMNTYDSTGALLSSVPLDSIEDVDDEDIDSAAESQVESVG